MHFFSFDHKLLCMVNSLKRIGELSRRCRPSVVGLTAVLIYAAALYVLFPAPQTAPAGGVATAALARHHAAVWLAALVLAGLTASARSRRPSLPLTLLTSGSAGAFYFVFTFGVKILDPVYVSWMFRGDWAGHLLSWLFFSNEPWHFPPGRIEAFGVPAGTSVGLTDCIPLLAMPLKLVAAHLPPVCQFFGLWFFLCYVLQGVFGALLMRTLTGNPALQVLGACFFIVNPALLQRVGHLALCGHWVLLAALWLAFGGRRGRSFRRPLAEWLALLAVGTWVHPYICAMAAGVALATYARWWLVEGEIGLKRFAAAVAVSSLAVSVFGWASGAIVLGGGLDSSAVGYGHYSMNLASPVDPAGWSKALRDYPRATAGQYEGFNFLGTGAIVVVLWAIYSSLSRPPSRTTVRRMVPFLALAAFYTAFAISDTVTLGGATLFKVPLPSFLLDLAGVFRSSGRFFWPVTYLLLFLSIGMVVRRNRPLVAAGLLGAALLLQVADSFDVVRHQLKFNETAVWENPLKDPFWRGLGRRYRRIVLYPALWEERVWPLCYLAARQGMSINVSSAARWDAERSERFMAGVKSDIEADRLDPRTVYVIGDGAFAQVGGDPALRGGCREIDGFHVLVAEGGHR